MAGRPLGEGDFATDKQTACGTCGGPVRLTEGGDGRRRRSRNQCLPSATRARAGRPGIGNPMAYFFTLYKAALTDACVRLSRPVPAVWREQRQATQERYKEAAGKAHRRKAS